MSGELFDTLTIDETARRRFEQARREGRHESLDEFLPGRDDPRYLPTLEELVHIDLEFAWKSPAPAGLAVGDNADQSRVVEVYLSRFPDLNQPAIVLRLLRQEYRVRNKYGDRPPSDSYRQRFPDLVHTGAEVETVGPCGPVPASSDTRFVAGQQIDRYRLNHAHASGGFGLVWHADDAKLGRHVALKQMKAALVGDEELRQRFIAEAKIAARLEHPGIVPVYDIGDRDEATPYYTMKFVGGETLDNAMARFHAHPHSASQRALEQLRLLNVFLAVTRTMEYAHSHGVIHRDLKPQNIIVGQYGETILLDWGLVKVRGETPGTGASSGDQRRYEPGLATQPGTIKGTPAYMSPEQAAGRTEEVDEGSDIYALGVILYQLLTGRLPFQGTAREVLQRICEQSPLSPRQIDPAIPRPLEAICRKAMARLPADRYGRVGELTRDLERYLADEPVEAWREPLRIRMGRWIRRHRTLTTGVAAAVAVLIVCLVIGIVLLTAANRRERAARQRTEESLYINRIALASRQWWSNNVEEADRLLDLCPPELRHWEWRYLKWRCHSELRTFRPPGNVAQLAFSPDGRLLACGSLLVKTVFTGNASSQSIRGGVLSVWSVESGQLVRAFPFDGPMLAKPVFSPDGGRLALVERQGQIRIWNTRTWAATTSTVKLDSAGAAEFFEVAALALEPDGGFVVLAGRRVLDAAGQTRATLAAGDFPTIGRFAPDRDVVASATRESKVLLWSVLNGQVLRTIQLSSTVNDLGFSADGRLLGVATRDGYVTLWSVDTGQPVHRLAAHVGGAASVAFSPDAPFLATTGADTLLKVWDARNGRELSTLRAHAGTRSALAFGPHARVASGSGDQTVKLWDGRTNQLLLSYQDETRGAPQALFLPITCRVHFSGDSRRLVSLTDRLAVWDLTSDQPVEAAKPVGLPLAIDMSHRWLACTALRVPPTPGDRNAELAAVDIQEITRAVEIQEITSGRIIARLIGHDQGVKSAAFSPDGRRIATGSWGFQGAPAAVIVWDVTTGRRLISLEAIGWGNISSLAFDPDAERLAVACEFVRTHNATEPGNVTIWNAATGHLIETHRGHEGRVHSVAFSPDGGRLVTTGSDATVQLWNLNTGEQRILRGHKRVECAVFDPSGKRVVSGGDVVRIWHAGTGEELFSLDIPRPEPSSRVQSLRFSPDGQSLAAGCSDGSVRLWGMRPAQTWKAADWHAP